MRGILRFINEKNEISNLVVHLLFSSWMSQCQNCRFKNCTLLWTFYENFPVHAYSRKCTFGQNGAPVLPPWSKRCVWWISSKRQKSMSNFFSPLIGQYGSDSKAWASFIWYWPIKLECAYSSKKILILRQFYFLMDRDWTVNKQSTTTKNKSGPGELWQQTTYFPGRKIKSR